jgi:hypothetical protein
MTPLPRYKHEWRGFSFHSSGYDDDDDDYDDDDPLSLQT